MSWSSSLPDRRVAEPPVTTKSADHRRQFLL